jgi:hypothetical protein
MLITTSEVKLVRLVRSFLSKPENLATDEEDAAWKELCREFCRIVRRRLGGKHRGWTDDDDLSQLVWVIFIQRLRTSEAEGIGGRPQGRFDKKWKIIPLLRRKRVCR